MSREVSSQAAHTCQYYLELPSGILFTSAPLLLLAGPENCPQTVPARVATFGFGFFCMIVLTSYTANLASLLVAKAQRNTITSIDDAIAVKLNICVLGAIKAEIQSLYPSAILIETSDDHESLAAAHPGPGQKCDAFITSRVTWERIAAGDYAALDCALEAEGGDESNPAAGKGPKVEGSKVAGQKLCQKDEDGVVDRRRDCEAFAMVGNVVRAIPLSVPVGREFVDVFSHRTRLLIEQGTYEGFKKRAEAETRRPTACAARGGEEEEGRGAEVSSMAGTLAISLACQLIAVIMCAVEYSSGKPIQKMLGFSMSDDDQGVWGEGAGASSGGGPGAEESNQKSTLNHGHDEERRKVDTEILCELRALHTCLRFERNGIVRRSSLTHCEERADSLNLPEACVSRPHKPEACVSNTSAGVSKSRRDRLKSELPERSMSCSPEPRTSKSLRKRLQTESSAESVDADPSNSKNSFSNTGYPEIGSAAQAGQTVQNLLFGGWKMQGWSQGTPVSLIRLGDDRQATEGLAAGVC
jgi:hypothetical protein